MLSEVNVYTQDSQKTKKSKTLVLLENVIVLNDLIQLYLMYDLGRDGAARSARPGRSTWERHAWGKGKSIDSFCFKK